MGARGADETGTDTTGSAEADAGGGGSGGAGYPAATVAASRESSDRFMQASTGWTREPCRADIALG
jgi:hypothetical protein